MTVYDPKLARIAYDAAKASIEAKSHYLPPWMLAELLHWIVLPDCMAKGQADHNLNLMLSRARTLAAAEHLEKMFRWERLGVDSETYFTVTKEELRKFAQLVRADAINQAATQRTPPA